MSNFKCSRCEEIEDGDYTESVEDPKSVGEMCCLDCLDEDEIELEINPSRKFNRDEFVKRMEAQSE